MDDINNLREKWNFFEANLSIITWETVFQKALTLPLFEVKTQLCNFLRQYTKQVVIPYEIKKECYLLKRRRQWQPTPVLLAGKSHGQRSLVGCNHGVATSQTRRSNFTFTFHFLALEKEMATHSSVLTWRIPGTGKPGGLPSRGSHRVGHDWSDLAAASVSPKEVRLMQMHSIHWRGGKRPKMVEEKKKTNYV